jgi:hypothetical protein
LGLYVADEIPYTVDIVSKGQTTESLNKNYTDGFLIIGRCYITEAYRKHDSSSPVITPNILLRPWDFIDSELNHPIFIRV